MSGAGGQAEGERVLRGIPVSHGIGIGPLFVAADALTMEEPAGRIEPGAVEAELERLAAALARAREDLARLRASAARKVGDDEARIFLVHSQLLDDPALGRQLEQGIREERLRAEAAVLQVVGRFSAAVARLEDPLARERAADVRDVGRRLLVNLSNRGADGDGGAGFAAGEPPDAPFILATHELFPSDAAHLSRERLAGIVTETGGKVSHAAILARALGIPAVTGVRDLARIAAADGSLAVVDGKDGTVVLHPSPATVEKYRTRAARLDRMRVALAAEPALPAVTKDGTRVDISINVENAGDLMPDQLGELSGIGLYRTEFVYMNRSSFPSEDEQFAVYRQVVEKVGDREVVFRTIDIGGDKKLPYFRVADEDNPALGWRGFRISDEWPDLFIAQVRALLRASAAGHVRIMLPMITTVEEVRRATAIVKDVGADLKRRGVAVADRVPLGVMIEVPAAAMAIDALLKEVDFVSIGSNDLIQYLLAVDRNNARVADLSQPLNPSVLKTIEMVVRAARAARKPVSLCGEMAGSYYCTLVLLGLGLRRFSMARHYVTGVGRLIQAVSLKEAEAVARRALAFATTGEVRAFVTARTREIFRKMRVPIEEADQPS